jgi:hypothetical protein
LGWEKRDDKRQGDKIKPYDKEVRREENTKFLREANKHIFLPSSQYGDTISEKEL